MGRQRTHPPEPAVSVRERVDVTLSADEVKRHLLAWLATSPDGVPQPANPQDVAVTVSCDPDTGQILDATLSYVPVPRADAGSKATDAG